ncbi:MAG: FMN-binding protein [Gammaproteobacteria bacterium]|nr:FMN-binding protein [Gammaproteobacteria bacterium]
MRNPLALLLLLALSNSVQARGVYQAPDDFLAEVFAGSPPPAAVVWLRGEVKTNVADILGHNYPALRIRYWGEGKRTAWILEEIGKEKPITVGLVVEDSALQNIRVLEFRESRGWEVRHGFFTDQFSGARLTGEQELDRSIDGISGATLSVRALQKLARLALYLHSQTPHAHDSP